LTSPAPSPGSASSASEPLLGVTYPRVVSPEPSEPLTRENTRGYDLADFAAAFGYPLMQHQAEAAKLIMQIDAAGLYRYREALWTMPRQNGKNFGAMWLILHRLLMHSTPQTVLGTAQTLAMGKELLEQTYRTMKSHPWLAAQIADFRRQNGQECLFLVNGSRYLIRAANADAGRGLSADLVVFDEIRSQENFEAVDALAPTTMARPDAQLLALSNSGNPRSVVMRAMRRRALSGSGRTLLVEHSAEPGCDVHDRAQWALANPALGRTMRISGLEAAVAGPADGFRREHLNMDVAEGEGAISVGSWDESADSYGQVPDDQRGRVAAAVDVAVDGRHVTLAAACHLPGDRIWVELAGWWDDVADATRGLDSILAKVRPAVLGWFPGATSGAIAPALRKRSGITELKGVAVTEACTGFAAAVDARRIVHPDDPLLNKHVSECVKMPSGDSWRFARRGSAPIDAAYAAAGAVYLLLNMPEPQRPRIRILQ
jgi:phage terminase large subunit-like protein